MTAAPFPRRTFGLPSRARIAARLRALGSEGRATLLLLLAVACIVIPHLSHLPAWACAVAAVAFISKIGLLARNAPVPNRWLLVLVTSLVSAGTVATYGTVIGRDAGVTLLVMLICVKLLEMRARRDVFVVIFLGFFVALCQFLYAQSMFDALLVALGTYVLIAALVGHHLQGDAGDMRAPGLRYAFKTAGRIVAYAVPIMLALFVLFPRLPGPLWGSPSNVARGSTGLSDEMTPGSISQLAESDAIAFRTRFDGPAPGQNELYWRALVLGQFDGRTWRENTRRLRTRPPATVVQALRTPVRYTSTLEPSGAPWLPVLDVATDAPRLIGNERVPGVRIAPDAVYTALRPLRDRLQMQAASATRYRLVPAETELSLREWLDLPPSFNPRTLELARVLGQRHREEPVALVNAVLAMFREQPFSYTLEPPALGTNSVDEFLFDTRAGFCEHYASAFVVLMRALDIPSRVVTGYQGGDTNPYDGYVEIRQRDAHAWAEVWLGAERGWVRVDPTAAVAPSRIERGVQRALPPRDGLPGLFTLSEENALVHAWRLARYRWDAVENAWNLWVIGYNADAQRDLFGALGIAGVGWRNLMLASLGVVAVLSAVMTALLLVKRPPRDPWLRVYQRFEKRLARAGLARDAHEGPAQYRARLVRSLDDEPGRARDVLRVFDALMALRYRPPAPRSEALHELSRCIATLDLPRSRSA